MYTNSKIIKNIIKNVQINWGQNLETGQLSRHYIAEISLNVTLNHN